MEFCKVIFMFCSEILENLKNYFLKTKKLKFKSQKRSNLTLFISHFLLKALIFKICNNKIMQKFYSDWNLWISMYNLHCIMYMHDAKEYKFYVYMNIIVKLEKLCERRRSQKQRIISEWVSLVTRKQATWWA